MNLLQEKLTTGSDAMEDDIRAIATENDKDAQHVEQLFDQVKTVKEKVNLLERDIQMVNLRKLVSIAELPIQSFLLTGK